MAIGDITYIDHLNLPVLSQDINYLGNNIGVFAFDQNGFTPLWSKFYTFSINEITGALGGIIDSFDYDLCNNSGSHQYRHRIIKITQNIIATTYQRIDNKVYVKTINVASDGTFVGAINTIAITDAIVCSLQIFIHVKNDIYLVGLANGTDGHYIELHTVRISDIGIISHISSHSWNGIGGNRPNATYIGNDIVVITNQLDTEIFSVRISDNGAISDKIDTWNSGITYINNRNCRLAHLYDSFYVFYWCDDAGNYNLSTLIIDSTGIITHTFIDTISIEGSIEKTPYTIPNSNIIVVPMEEEDIGLEKGYIKTFSSSNGFLTELQKYNPGSYFNVGGFFLVHINENALYMGYVAGTTFMWVNPSIYTFNVSLATIPTITTLPAMITNIYVRLNAYIITAFRSIVGFEYGSTSALGTTVICSGYYTSGYFYYDIILLPGTYYFRAFATNYAGTSYGATLSFIVPPGSSPLIQTKPEVKTLAATEIGE